MFRIPLRSRFWSGGEGVCQDHAHVFIASARAVGMPARYVSGYCTPGIANDAAQSHAWVEVCLGSEIGWQSMDVTSQAPRGAHVLLPGRGPRLLGCGAGARRAPEGGGGEKNGSQRAGRAESAKQQ